MKKKSHKYDKVLIEKLCKNQPKGDFNATDVTKKYCKKKGIDFSVYRARRLQGIISNNDYHISAVTPKKSVQYKNASKKTFKSGKKNFIITYAQAKTPIHEELWVNIKAYAKTHDAEIIVFPGTYLNPNSPYSQQVKREHSWDAKLEKYLYATRAQVHDHMMIIADTDIIPTAKRPLNGLHSLSGIESCVIGHPRQQMVTVPTMKNSRNKFMFTTGAITVPNYRAARVGTEAKEHHKIGFLFVENLSEDDFTARHISAEEDGSFQDLTYRVENGKISQSDPWEVMIFGDTHLSKEDPTLLEEARRLIKVSSCKETVWHDLFDGYSINHHESKDYVSQVIKSKKGLNSLEGELRKNMEFITEWKDTNMTIIPSNHHDWIDKWVRLNQGLKDKDNAFIFNVFQSVLFQERAPKGLYAYVVEQNFKDEVRCLHRDDSHNVCGFEINNHGDLGANGAKGSPLTFVKLNTPIVSADKHHMYTIDNAYGVGVSSRLDHGYNKGMSNWGQGNGIILSNGRFQHLMCFNGKFTNLI